MITGLLIVSVVAAALTVVWLKPTDRNRLKLLIAFSGSYLLSITALHLLPEVFIGWLTFSLPDAAETLA